MSQSFAALYVHFVWSTRGREELIRADWQQRLYAYFGGILKEGSKLLEAGGVADHVHLLVSLSRQTSVAEAARLLKCNSSGWVHQTFPDLAHFAWQQGYGAFTVSHSALDDVRRYLVNQAQHHSKRTFQDEFRILLQKHDIEYDERYIWD
jgi:REP element-mobilizing transposase RayT